MSFAFVACVNDDTVTSFKDLNKVDISGLDLKYTVLLYDNLTISPIISTSQNDDSKLSYLWYIHQTNAAPGKDTLSREMNLDVEMLPNIVTPGLPYTLIFKVTDETTGVYYRKEMAVDINTLYTKGTLLLCKDGGNTEVNFLRLDEERTLLENVYTMANDGQLAGSNPLNIYAINPNEQRVYMKKVLIACSDENGGMYANPITFQADKAFRDGFEKPLTENLVTPTFYAKVGQIEYIIMNGQVHKRATNMGADQWEAPCVCVDGEAEYDVAPYIFDFAKAIFYDRKNGRLLTHDPYNKGALHELLADESGKLYFDNNNIGVNMELICCGGESAAASMWLLMKNTDTDKLFLLKFKMAFDRATGKIKFVSTANIELTTSVAPNIYDAVSFSANYSVDDFLMYATSDKVYSLNVSSKIDGSLDLKEALQLDLGPDNMEITKLEFVKIDVAEPTEDDPDATRVSNQLRMSVKDNNLSEKKGGVVFYEVSSEGGLHSTHVFTKTGFCDEVVDMDEKYS